MITELCAVTLHNQTLFLVTLVQLSIANCTLNSNIFNHDVMQQYEHCRILLALDVSLLCIEHSVV